MRAVQVFAVACLLPLALPAAQSRKAPRVNLDGTYKIVSGEKDGKPEPKDRIEGAVVVINGNKITGTDRDKKEFFACSFKITTCWPVGRCTRMLSTLTSTRSSVSASYRLRPATCPHVY